MAGNMFDDLFSDDNDKLEIGDGGIIDDDSDELDFGNNETKFGGSSSKNYEEDLEFEDDGNFLEKELPNNRAEEEPEDEITAKKKTALFAIALGIIILIVGAIIANIALKSRQNRADEINAKYTEYSETQPSKQTKAEHKKSEPVNNSVTPIISDNDQWIEVDLDEQIEFQASISSDFTVTGIKHYAKVANSNNDKSLKTIVTGSISGLTGTYEMEVPTDKAQKLKIGSIFAVEYNMSDRGSYKLIGNVHYK